MKLRVSVATLVFALGAGAGLIGDRCHVITGTTEYLSASHRVPFLWSSPIWFPILVAIATVMLAELRLHLPAVRSTVSVRHGLAGVAAVLGIYATTALLHASPATPITVLISALAAITWCVLGDRFAAVCGALAAVVGVVVEIGLVAADVFRYTEGSDGLFGVAPWLPALYFAFGVVAALVGEIEAEAATPGR
ncbi:diacylglycerol-binding protein [Mycobacterium spongiae]|uniref:Uncharacterized protein n=1 Tax=Mycobacterium spongiae TaxID=886343 RepID=A0A975JYR3_9MYCO|nr:hypothetical protein [Mycobacterium spongiae]QUR68176.1 hypothetical protein F6B93_14770 [Mycobacterium spongiae]